MSSLGILLTWPRGISGNDILLPGSRNVHHHYNKCEHCGIVCTTESTLILSKTCFFLVTNRYFIGIWKKHLFEIILVFAMVIDAMFLKVLGVAVNIILNYLLMHNLSPVKRVLKIHCLNNFFQIDKMKEPVHNDKRNLL